MGNHFTQLQYWISCHTTLILVVTVYDHRVTTTVVLALKRKQKLNVLPSDETRNLSHKGLKFVPTKVLEQV